MPVCYFAIAMRKITNAVCASLSNKIQCRHPGFSVCSLVAQFCHVNPGYLAGENAKEPTHRDHRESWMSISLNRAQSLTGLSTEYNRE